MDRVVQKIINMGECMRFSMKEYDIIAFGTGSSMNIVSPLLANPKIKVAVIENEKAGGICLTRGCIPSKMLVYPAEIVHTIHRAREFFMDVKIKSIDSSSILQRVQREVDQESKMIERSLKSHPRIDYYNTTGKFVGDHTVEVGGKEIYGDKILLCNGSRPLIPPIEGLEDTGYITNREIFYTLKKLPKSLVIIGGGYVALELGYFMAMMGTDVKIVEMLPRLISMEEPEVSQLVLKELSSHMKIHLQHRAREVRKRRGKKIVVAENKDGETVEFEGDEILVATGRKSNSDITAPEKTGVRIDDRGWVITNEFMETTKDNIWACGDANGKHMFKHVANEESEVVFYNAFRGKKIPMDYHAVPHAIFTHPQVASVGMREEEAKQKHDILVGYYKYENTAMGEAMRVKDYFVKIIVDKDTYRILGAHIAGPEASILIQEIINLMYTQDGSAIPLFRAMHIHPAMNEVVQRAIYNLKPR